MHAAIIENGVVVNTILAEDPLAFGAIPCDDTVSVGWEYDGESFVAPEAPEPDPVDPLTLTLTKRQINTALILSGITDPDGFIETAIATILDDTQRALALNDWRYAPYYERTHPLFNDAAMLTATGMTEQQVNDLWALASQYLA